MSEVIYIRNNTPNPIEVQPKVGAERVRFEPQCWNEVPSGYIERITGGLKSVGRGRGAKLVPKGNGSTATFLFTETIRIGGRNIPRLQIGTPVEGDSVHTVVVRPGLRSHYRTRQAEDRSKREVEQERAIAGLEARLEVLTQRLTAVNGSTADFDPTGMDVDSIKAALEDLDLAAVRQAIGIEVAGENRAPVVKVLRSRARKLSKG